MALLIRLSIALSMLLTLAAHAQDGFRHPGILVDKAQLAFVRQQIEAGNEPWATAFKVALASPSGALNYVPKRPPDDHLVLCGPYSNPNHGCSEEGRDSAAAYLQALLWNLTGNAVYAENAIRIMNTWARNLTGGHQGSNAPLQSAWTVEKWPAAAELIRHTYSGWQAADVEAFRKMLLEQYLPYISGSQGAGKNGNWQLSMIDGMAGIAVFTDDRALFDKAMDQWRTWVPAYVYHFPSDGEHPVVFRGGPSGWNGQRVFDATTSGVTQETCRDLAHTGYGIAAIFSAAETAHLQGTDLLTPMQPRLTTMLEYHAHLLQGVRVRSEKNVQPTPPDVPNLCAGTYVPVLQGTMERAYYAYHVRRGVALPQTAQYLRETMRPLAPPTEFLTQLWETLTHGSVLPAK